MNRVLIVLLAICMVTTARVPKIRRDLKADEEAHTLSPSCASRTPCGWTVYKADLKNTDQFITNTYCRCNPGSTCEESELDPNANVSIYRCKSSQPVPIETPES